MSVHPKVAEILRDVIGLQRVDEEDPLHAQLIEAIMPLGPGSSFGQRVVALRFVFNWELREAGRVFAKAKTDYEHFLAKKKAALMLADGYSGVKASAIAEGDDEAYGMKLAYLMAEQRERAMRKFLESLEAALDNHRTDRADLRAGDRAHAGGYSGGA